METISQSYWMPHRPSDCREFPEYRLDKLTDGGVIPADFIDKPWIYVPDAFRYGGKAIAGVMKAVQGKPDEEIYIYRGAPDSILHTGDWVTLSPEYAAVYSGTGMYAGEGSETYRYKVKASDISFDGDDLHEFGYWGPDVHGEKVA